MGRLWAMCGLTETTRHCAGDKQLTTTRGVGHLLATGRDVYCLSFRCCLFSRRDRWPRRAGDRLGHLGAAIFERGTASNVARMWSALIQNFEIYLRCPDTTISQPMAQQPSCTTDRRLTSQPGPAVAQPAGRFRSASAAIHSIDGASYGIFASTPLRRVVTNQRNEKRTPAEASPGRARAGGGGGPPSAVSSRTAVERRAPGPTGGGGGGGGTPWARP